jgi:hypothetical protein
MLDVRLLAYVSPLNEQEIGPILPTVTIQNAGDEDATLTGLFRIYRESTGLLEYTSVLHPAPLDHGTTSPFTAETEFNPGQVVDDDYFILCSATAISPGTGQLLQIQLGAFHFDTKAPPMGPVPAGHHTTHENGGMDEVSIAGLHGILGDTQPVAAHATTHEQGAADALEVRNLGTSEADNSLVLAPNGTGGVEFRAESGGGGGPHHLTHENGGTDEISITGLSGLAGDAQTPAAHQTSHQDSGTDEISIAGLSGQAADAQTPTNHHLTHEAGGSDIISIPPGITDHGALSGLLDDDHPQYRLRHEIFFESEFLYRLTTNSTTNFPWYALAIASGTEQPGSGVTNHPGIAHLLSSTNANSGFYCITGTSAILLQGNCTSICCHRPITLSGTTRHHGFHDSTSVTDPVDGAWIWQDPTTGIIYGRTMKNSTGSTTGTGFQLITNTWYTEKIVVNSNASRVDFYIYDDAGNQLWTDNLSTNIPTAAGRELGHGVVVSNSGTSAVALDDIDYLSIKMTNRRPNV